MRNTFINTILEASKIREDIFVISGDAGLGVFDELKEGCAENFLNLGVAEQNMISFSAGLSLSGFKVYAYNIIPFLLYRCYEQVRNDVCYQRLPVTLAGIGSGVTYSPQGMTHYSVEDLGIAQTLPNLTVFSPIDPIEAQLAAEYSLHCNSPVYVRLAKRGEPNIHADTSFKITVPQLLQDGEDVAIVFHGSIGIEVMKAREMLTKAQITPKLISLPMVLPLDTERLFALLENIKYVVTIEEHYVGCGIGSMIAKAHARVDPRWKLFTLGISDAFIHEIKDLDGMRDHFGISARKIATFVNKIVK
ncbi:transketolase family protein [Candidatus Omnitrophota bacterium]